MDFKVNDLIRFPAESEDGVVLGFTVGKVIEPLTKTDAVKFLVVSSDELEIKNVIQYIFHKSKFMQKVKIVKVSNEINIDINSLSEKMQLQLKEIYQCAMDYERSFYTRYDWIKDFGVDFPQIDGFYISDENIIEVR